MATKEEKIQLYTEKLQELGYDVDAELLEKIVKMLWPSIYKLDAELVACSDNAERDRIVENFLIKKLNLTDEPAGSLIESVNEVCEELKESRRKYRPVFYYILAKKLNASL